MYKKILLASIFSLAATWANADPVSDQMLMINSSSARIDNNLWQRMRDGFKLDHKETKEVKYWEKRYGNPKYFNIIMQNAAPYLYFVVTEMERRGMPSELALIPIVESTYNPNAVSPAAISTGMWQFVSSSGKRFGLAQNSDLDERKDIVKSTRAAISYLQYLHDMFGSWELAIAAYNWGEGNINNAINRSKTKNFYDLDVRDITHQYVPKVIALANIIQNPSKFGIKLTDLNNSPYFAIVQPDAPITLNNFMTMANLNQASFKKLNPQFYSSNYIANPSQRLLLPVSNQPIYLANLQPSTTKPTATIADGATAVIASNSQSDTESTNNTADDKINQLAALGDDSTDNINVVNNQDTVTKVTQAPIASTSPTPATKSQINDLLTDSVVTGSAVTTVKTNSPAAKAINTESSFISYIVEPGDTLYSIAKRFSVPVDSIKADNQLVDNTVKLNQKLLIRTNKQT